MTTARVVAMENKQLEDVL